MRSRVFIVEDEGLIALELETCLERAGFQVDGIADNAEDALREIAESLPDVVLMDIRIKGDRDGIWAAGEIRKRLNLPVIFVTAHGDDETLDRARAVEPFGYLVKPFINVSFRTQLQTVIWKHKAESLVRSERAWLSSTLNHVSEGILATDSLGSITYMNAEAERVTGCTAEEAKGLPLLEVFAVYNELTGLPVVSPIHSVHQGREPSSETTVYHLSSDRTNGVVVVEVNVSVNRDETGLVGLIVTFRDITSSSALALRQRQRERLQAVEALATGLGRDLSQLLAALNANIDLLCVRVPEPLQELARATRKMGTETSEWVAQMTELGSRELPFTDVADLNQIVRDVVRDPQTALVGAWTCTLDLVEGPAPVMTHAESCRRNLIRTLREMRKAMPKGGSVRISTWARDGEFIVCIRDDERKSRLRSGAPDRLFDPYHLHADRARRSNGLALTLLHHFMSLTGGTAECSGDGPEENLVLTLHFPAAAHGSESGRGNFVLASKA